SRYLDVGQVVFYLVVAGLTAWLFAFSQTRAFFGDEGFHLLAAQLIAAGKRPYLDFFYQHTPLYIYVVAAWMKVFGGTWRSAHCLSVLLTGASILLAGRFAGRWFGVDAWGRAAGVTAATFFGLHWNVQTFGTVGQAYALCFVLMLAAFLLVIRAVDQENGI